MLLAIYNVREIKIRILMALKTDSKVKDFLKMPLQHDTQVVCIPLIPHKFTHIKTIQIPKHNFTSLNHDIYRNNDVTEHLRQRINPDAPVMQPKQ